MEHLYFFGRFNFPHAGYLYVISEGLKQLHPKNGITIIFSAQKTTWDKKALPIQKRQAMFTLALQELPAEVREQIHFSTIEETMHSGGYTIHTLRELQKQNTGETGIIMGADAAIGIPEIHAGFTAWKEWEEILKRATLIVVPRGRFETKASVQQNLDPRLEEAIVLDTHPTSLELHASSTAIQQGKTEFLSPSVLSYAREHHLLVQT